MKKKLLFLYQSDENFEEQKKMMQNELDSMVLFWEGTEDCKMGIQQLLKSKIQGSCKEGYQFYEE